MKRPLAAVVAAYVAGLLAAEFLHPPPVTLFAVTFAVLALALLFEKLRPRLIWLLLALAGWTNLASRTAIISPHDLRLLIGNQAALATVRGTLLETPNLKIYIRDSDQSEHTLARVRVSALQRDDHWQPAAGLILVSTPTALGSNYFAGQPVEISGVIAPPPLPVAGSLFDYRHYLRLKGIYYQLKTASPADWKLRSTRTTPPWSDRFLAWSKKTLAHGLSAEDEPLKLLWAMTLGWKTALTSKVAAPFMQSGTMHIFAISGLHIALIAGILVAILRVLQVPRFWCGLVIIPLLWFYTAATGWQPSAIRATIMMTIVLIGWALKRPGNLINSLAAAAFIILLYDPQQLFQASFQLSFVVVLSIALFMPPLEKLRNRLLQTDPLLPPQLVPRWRRGLHSASWVVSTWFATSLAAWFGSWPLTAYYFHLFSPVTLLANLMIIPLASAALACNLGSLLCGAWFPWATQLFNHSGWLWMKMMLEISRGIIQPAGAFCYVSGPRVADLVIYYSALFAVLSGVVFKKTWCRPAMVGIAGIAIFYGWRWHDARQTTTLTVLPLNGGHAVFVQAGKSADDLLVDCGDTNSVGFITGPFLHAHGVNRLPRLALTQGDVRDLGGAPLLCDQFSVGQIITSPVKFRSAIYRQTLAMADRTPGRHVVVSRGETTGNWQVLYPTATNRFSQADDNSLVLRSEVHGTHILLLSDLARLGQADLISQSNDLRADIVVTGLPEKTEPLGKALLDAVQPKVIIVADAEFPATKRASPALRERLAQTKIPVIYTGTSGAVTIITRPGAWEVWAMDGQKIKFP